MGILKILLVGISTRGMAQSAAAAGYDVISLDFFGDRDQPPGMEVYSLARDFHRELTVSELGRAAEQFVDRVDGVMVTSGLENDADLLRLVTRFRRSWNNSIEAVNRVRDDAFLREILKGTGVRVPEAIHVGEQLPRGGRWLVKDRSHSGGMGVSTWDGQTSPGENCLLQRFVEGQLGSIAFAADGRRAQILGATLQYSGVEALAAPPFAWCGNTAPWTDETLMRAFEPALQRLVERAGLRGINGVDFIAAEDGIWLIEVNPRPGASVDLLERGSDFNAFELHKAACEGTLPVVKQPALGLVYGKGILYAGQEICVRDNPGWLSGEFGDVPHAGETIPTGSPVCTIYASGESHRQCWDKILQRASAMGEGSDFWVKTLM